METGKVYQGYAEGNAYDGYRTVHYLVRNNFQNEGVGANSLRDARGHLVLRSNPYNISRQIASFRPGKRVIQTNAIRDGVRMWLENTQYYYPTDWTNPVRHLDTTKTPSPHNRAKMKLFDKILENKASMAVTFAERQASIDMAASHVRRVFNAWRAIKKGDFKRSARVLGIDNQVPRSKQASGQWLELQYGWLPLLGDAHTLLNFNPFAGDFIKGRARETVEYTSPKGSRVVDIIKVEYGAQITVSDPMVGFMNQIGVLNPALVAWELVPFSFVIDWFLPVGDHLDYLTALCGLSVKNGYLSEKRDYHLSFSGEDGLSIASSNSSMKRTTFTEKSLGVPKLRPTNPLSPMHLANAIALGRQLKKE